MRFGLQAPQVRVDWQPYVEMWQELDRNSRLHSIWVMDHFVGGMGGAEGADEDCFEGWTALAALAQATERVRVGVLVTGNTYRHPAVLAKQATTIDHISNSRLEFGLGAAWHEYEHNAYGIPFPGVKERLDRLEEAARLIRLLWTEDRPAFEGTYYRLKAPPYNPPNVQKPHPPMMIGGSGEKRTLRIVARYGDACNVQDTPASIRRKFEVLDRHCRDAGRDPSEIRRTAMVPLFYTDNPDVQARVLQGMQAFAGVSEDEARTRILMGSAAEVIEQVRQFQDAGVQEIILGQFPAVHMKSLMRFSEEVIPHFS